MSTFAELAAMPGVGAATLLSVSVDNWSTTLYRWATHAGTFGGAVYEDRIVDVGNHSRSLGADYTMQAATVNITLDNTDLGCDPLVLSDESGAFLAFKASFRLTLALINPLNVADIATLQLGQFACLDSPSRDNATMRLVLADDLLTRAGELAESPSVNDWIAATDTPGNRPAAITSGVLYNRASNAKGFDWDAPLPICFGSGPHVAQRVVGPYFVICAVAEDRATADTPSISLADGEGSTAPLWTSTKTTTSPMTPLRSCNITKGGKTWHILFFEAHPIDPTSSTFLTPHPGLLQDFPRYQKTLELLGRLPLVIATRITVFEYGAALDAMGPIQCTGYPFSQITESTAPGASAAQTVADLLTYYSANPSAFSVDATALARALSMRPGIFISGTISSSGQRTGYASAMISNYSMGDMADALRGLATVGRFDIVFGHDAVVYLRLHAQDFAFSTTTPPTIPEENVVGVLSVAHASKGERGEAMTRLFVSRRGIKYGAFVHGGHETTLGRSIEKTISADWLSLENSNGVLFDYSLGTVGAVVAEDLVRKWVESFVFDSYAQRLSIVFTTTLEVLAYELGDVVLLSWTRGGASADSSLINASWRIEGLTLRPLDGVVEVRALWVSEVRGWARYPYLLDDESMAVRVLGGGGRTITLTNGSATVLFSSGSLVSDGVAAGDILVVRDSSEAATAFKRNRALYVASVTDATHLVVAVTAGDGTDFGATTAGIADWNIYRGAITYHTAVSSPTNYPSGGAVYGKISDSLNTNGADSFYGDNLDANRLVNG